MVEPTAPPLFVPSIVFSLVALLCISIVVILILRHFLPLRSTPAYLLVPVFFALWLPASMVLLVPIDLASSAMVDDLDARGIWLPARALKVSWRINYWLTFALTWFILPILGEYSDSGYREAKAKLVDSLRANAQYYAIVFGSGVLGFVYVLWSYGHFSTSLKSTIIALAYCWGLVLVIYLMGHGLVSIPRRLFRSANISGRLRRIQSQAPRAYEKMTEAEMDLEDLELQIGELSRRKGGSVSLFEDWVEELVDMVNLPESQPGRDSIIRGTGDRSPLPNVITEKYLAELTRRFLRARHARARYVSEWNRLLEDAVRTQAILDSAASKKLEFGKASPAAGFCGRFALLTPYTRYLLHYRLVPYLQTGLAIVLSLASICIVWSEVVKGILPQLSVIRYSVVHHNVADKGQVGPAGQAIAALWMMYMCAAALISITEVKVWRGRALVRRNTAPESAFWYASQVARLSVPLTYNFMTFLGLVYKDTVFYRFLGVLIDLTPLGEWFDYLFPAFILVPVCATLFGLYGRVRRAVGFGIEVLDHEDEDDGGAGPARSWREGRDLIERELNGASAAIRARRAGGPRAAPILSIPRAPAASARADGPTTPFGTSPSAGFSSHPAASHSRRHQANTSARRTALPDADDDDDDETFFESLGHRMRNTFDTLETPRWLADLGQGIPKPKWMAGNNNNNNNNGHNGAGRSQGQGQSQGGGGLGGGADIRRWFGGGRGEGRIRL
ncbi:hypothetical protein VTJ83DRAFT_1010 [Remersonia thermophila]|uniref:Lysosomal cobalamin transporter n=1 Tax=Remersonia thermophila TaxID=72144 RepID=A0ABR4DNF4_9PEZI